MYADLLGSTQDPSGNPYLFTKLVTLSIGCTTVPISRDITGPFTHAALPIQRATIENLESLQFFHGRGFLCSQQPLDHTHFKGKIFHPNSNERYDQNK